MVELLTARSKHIDLMLFLERLKALDYSFELVIENGFIDKIHVRMPDNGDWSDIAYGRIVGSKVVSYKRTVYLPRLVDGVFIYNYNEKEKKAGRE